MYDEQVIYGNVDTFSGTGLVFDYVPRSFQIFGMEFTIYGVLIAVGALLGMGIVTLEAKRMGKIRTGISI